MEVLPAPIFQKVYRNVDGVELSDQNYELVDGFLDEMGATRKRPGLFLAIDLALGDNKEINGLYWWEHKSKLAVVSAGKVHFVTYTSGSFVVTSMTQTDLLNEDRIVSFATDGTYLFMANGGRIVYTDGVATAQYISDAGPLDPPATVTHVAFIDGYLLANKTGENRCYYSEVGDSLTFTAGDYFSAAGDADYITALWIINREIYLLGPSSTEIWEDDGTNPFSRITSGFLQVGIIAPNSVVNLDNTLYWFSNNRYFVRFSGSGEPERISTPYDKEIQSFETVSDCFGMHIEIEGKPFLVFHFASESKTIVYNVAAEDWSEWRYFNTTTGNYERWLGNCYAYCPAWGFHIVGSRIDSKLYKMSGDYYDDDGAEIRLSRITGHINYGTLSTKRSHKLSLILKRGGGELPDRTPVLMVRWNDDNKGFGNQHEISLGDVGETQIIKNFRRTGVFRTRQYEFTATDSVPIIFLNAEEEFEVLGR